MINNVLEVIKNRRSTRAFRLESIADEIISQILEAGIYAPSAHNEQSWHFTVIRDKNVIDEISNKTKEAMRYAPVEFARSLANNEKFHVFYQAPVVIMVSGNKSALLPQIDCAAATQNMLLAAESLGIGSCWIGLVAFLFNNEHGDELLQKLAIPEEYRPMNAVALGYKENPNQKAPARREGTVNFHS